MIKVDNNAMDPARLGNSVPAKSELGPKSDQNFASLIQQNADKSKNSSGDTYNNLFQSLDQDTAPLHNQMNKAENASLVDVVEPAKGSISSCGNNSVSVPKNIGTPPAMDYRSAIGTLYQNFKLIAEAKGEPLTSKQPDGSRLTVSGTTQIDKNDLRDIAYNNPAVPSHVKEACKFFLDNPAYFNKVENSASSKFGLGHRVFDLDNRNTLDLLEVQTAFREEEVHHSPIPDPIC